VLLVAFGFPATLRAADVKVFLVGAQVDLDATAAPLADVLDRLTRQTGMKLVYEGAAPRNLVTVKVRGRSPAETVLAVLEGLGVNFVLVADPTRDDLQTLMISGASSSSRAAGAGSGPAKPPTAPAVEDDWPQDDADAAPDDLDIPPPIVEPDQRVPVGPAAPAPMPPSVSDAPGAANPSAILRQLYPASPFATQLSPFAPRPPAVAPVPAGPPPTGDSGSPQSPGNPEGQAPPP
jgi:hypothetical protein